MIEDYLLITSQAPVIAVELGKPGNYWSLDNPNARRAVTHLLRVHDSFERVSDAPDGCRVIGFDDLQKAGALMLLAEQQEDAGDSRYEETLNEAYGILGL